MTFVLAGVLSVPMMAEDKNKEKVKIDGRDPVTGEKIKVRSKVKSEPDGDYKEKTDIRQGDTHTKRKVKVDDDGDVKVKEKTHGPDGKAEYKAKQDK